MSDTPESPAISHARPTRTLDLARWIVRHRFWVALTLIAATLFFLYPILNAVLRANGIEALPGPAVRVDTSARAQWPDHPFIHAQDQFARKFGTSSLVAIGVVVRDGSIFTPARLAKIHEITRRLDGVGFASNSEAREELRAQLEQRGRSDAEIVRDLDRRYPPYPVNHDQLRSLAHSSTRAVQIEPDGSISSAILMAKVPESAEEAERLRGVVLQNPPFIYGRLVSWDEQGALITAGFVTDRLSSAEVYTALFDHVMRIKADFDDPACRGSEVAGLLRRLVTPITRLFTGGSSVAAWPEGCELQLFVSGSRSTWDGSSSTPTRSGSSSASR